MSRMRWPEYLRSAWHPRLCGERVRRTGPSGRAARYRPRLEALEDRHVPSTLTVTSAADSGPGSLRAEIAAAKSGDTIAFDPSLDGQTITLTSGALVINQSLDIEGPGAGQLTVSGNNASQVFGINPGASVTIAGLTIANGQTGGPGFPGNGGGISNLGMLTVVACNFSADSAGEGGAVYNQGPATLNLTACNISGCSAFQGGAIENNGGTVNVNGCTISGNAVQADGVVDNFGTLTVTDSTISGNNGAGISNYAQIGPPQARSSPATVVVTRSTVCDNFTAPSAEVDIVNQVNTGGQPGNPARWQELGTVRVDNSSVGNIVNDGGLVVGNSTPC